MVVKEDIELSPEPPSSASVLSQRGKKDDLRAAFYLLTGKPDSKSRLFKRHVILTADDIRDLHTKIAEKLALHNIEATTVTALVKFAKSSLIEFGSWTEFDHFDWKKPYATRELALRWDFLIKLPEYQMPQRHMLTFRVAAPPSPQEVLRLVMTHDWDDELDLDGRLALAVARVDFISHRLADELIDVVEEWVDGLRQPEEAHNWFTSLGRLHLWIPRVIHVSTAGLVALMSWSALHNLAARWAGLPPSTVTPRAMEWLFLSLLGVAFAHLLGRFLGARAHQALHSHGAFTPFALTRGDDSRRAELIAKNKKEIRRFLVSTAIAIAINIVSGIIAAKLLP